ncbi:DUF2179 domain-containing protein [Paenibacillus sp. A3]|uniref:DUF2179 domain-containing protein n=1 Tax=Paenibacillus sp. A3 TaxID=1337054 RepID=UPI0006D59F06|nr:DUF5698 domain-containing protein [Paenibacillus sp. A3]
MIYVLMAVVQIAYVALNSFRVVLMIKGKNYLASAISTIEIFIYISGLSLVLNYTESSLGLIVYSVSFGAGILLGMYIEQKIALGYIALQVVSEYGRDLAPPLRAKGYGVTVWAGEGAQGMRSLYLIVAKRKEYGALRRTVLELDPKAFLFSYEPMQFSGGYWAKKLE